VSVVRPIRRMVLRAAEYSGVNGVMLGSGWRGRRLLIICWHHISLDDEHVWNPGLCVSAATFRSRLELLRSTRCNVMPLGEALARLRSGSLPERAVALTLDDGDSSIFMRAWPMLREFAFPATLYWSTYYSLRPYAVFDPMLSYLLWKGRGTRLQLADPLINVQLASPEDRAQAFRSIYATAQRHGWTAADKEDFLVRLAEVLAVDYADIKRKRILHMISPEEAASMCAQGLDLQLHTHRHRVPRDASRPSSEIADNSRIIESVGAPRPVHFCYPSGSYVPELELWLRDNGVLSGATCDPGLVRRSTNQYFLPRMLDQENLGPAEFKGWLSGLFTWMTRRAVMDEHGFQ
jgi:peptidoglycan/xylan/chitin deacetylase (PgdA/CDA1 family)